MALLGFILECATIAALLGLSCSVLGLIVLALQPVLAERVGAPTRADLAFVAGILPVLVTVAGTTSAAMPSVAAALGVAADHCHHHSHHLHVCFVHSTGIRPDVALFGAIALAVWIVRTCPLVWNALRVARDLRRLERLGAPLRHPMPVVEVPGTAPLCHAVGWFRGRVLLGADLAARLQPSELRCALAHERAHLRRRDPLASLLLSVAGLFTPPPISRALSRVYRNAAEEACDEEAAREVEDSALVAASLVAVARAQKGAPWPTATAQAFGFGEHRLERRVRRLLDGTPSRGRRTYALPAAVASAALIFGAALQQSPFLHHAVETVLHRLF